jgi:4-amino-4-deoxy-L-arabinose transferase-like glycosyltransferase
MNRIDEPSVPSFTRQVPRLPRAGHAYSAYIGLSLALFVYASYLLFYSGVFHSSDAKFILAATESMVKRGEFVTSQLWWHQDAIETVAPDGEPYSKYGISASLLAAPLYILALNWPSLGMVQAVMLTNLLVTAVNAILVLKLVRALGYGTGIALSVSLLFGLGTSSMVYAHYYFTEPLSALAFTGAILGLYLYRAQGQERYAWLAGIALSLAVSTKLLNALFLIPLLVYALNSVQRQISAARHTESLAHRVYKVAWALLPVGLPLALTLAILGAYNALRFDSPFVSGYPPWERFDHPMLAGLWGLLFSSEKGLFVYNPVLIASLFAFPLFWRRYRSEALTVLGIAALHVITYARWHDWRGGVAWGPRFLVPLLPLLILPLAPLLAMCWRDSRREGDDEARQRSRWVRSHVPIESIWQWLVCAGLLVIGGVSLGVQVVGSGVSFLHYGDEYGKLAAKAGSALYQRGLYWPVLGQALLFQPANWDVAWVQTSGNRVTIDWGTLVMLVSFFLLATFGLIISYRFRHDAPHRWPVAYQITMVVVAVSVSLTLLLRSHGDNRFGGGEDYRALLQTLANVSRPDDLVLLNNHIYTDFFFNHNRSLSRWYALDRQANAPPIGTLAYDRTAQLLTRSMQRYRRIWFVTDLSPDSAEARPVEAWLTERAYKVDEVVFSPYARLLLYDTAPNPQSTRQVLNAQLGENIELMAFDLSALSRSEPVRLTLYWRALGVISQDLMVFVQLLDSSGKLAWQVDRYPVDGFHPTNSWDVGEIIMDRYGWQLPAELPSGEYRLIAGLYNWQTGQRLSITDSQGAPLGDHVVLTTVSIPPSVDD